MMGLIINLERGSRLAMDSSSEKKVDLTNCLLVDCSERNRQIEADPFSLFHLSLAAQCMRVAAAANGVWRGVAERVARLGRRHRAFRV
jgi:hypothetical protein